MRKITIDCTRLSPAALHAALAEALDFPDWYGNNLDALYDCLTDLEEEIWLTVRNLELDSFRDVLTQAAGDNPRLEVTLE